MSSESRRGYTLFLVFIVLWLGVLTILIATPAGKGIVGSTSNWGVQPAGAEQSTRQMLCTDALERRQAAEKVLASTPLSSELYPLWKKSLVVAQAQLDRANADKGAYCR